MVEKAPKRSKKKRSVREGVLKSQTKQEHQFFENSRLLNEDSTCLNHSKLKEACWKYPWVIIWDNLNILGGIKLFVRKESDVSTVFQTKIQDVSSERPTRIFVAVHQLRDSNRVSMEDESWLRDYLRYFNEHLNIPTCLKECEHRREICGFKEGRSMIDRVWNLKAFMKE